MSVIIQGPKLPQGYELHQLSTGHGRRYRTRSGDWVSRVRRTIPESVTDAYNHYYVMSGAKPILRQLHGGRLYMDVISGYCVTEAHIAIAKSYSGAFRLRSVEVGAQIARAEFEPMRRLLASVASQLEEVAHRLEVRSGRPD